MLKSSNKIEDIIVNGFKHGGTTMKDLNGIGERDLKKIARRLSEETDDALFECWCKLIEISGVKQLLGN